MDDTPTGRSWPELRAAELDEPVAYLRRLVQVASKYTLDQLYEPSWGNLALTVTSRGLSTPTLYVGDVTFAVHYRLLDDDVVIEANTGRRRLPLRDGTVADFYREFTAAAGTLGLPRPGSTVAAEISGAAPLDTDTEVRPWSPAAARTIWQAFDAVSEPLIRWQAPYRAHRPRVGVMWGGFDLAATRYRATPLDPPADRPVFQQNGMAEHVVAAGFALPSAQAPDAAIYAYITPEPPGLAAEDFGPDARWVPDAGLIVLPWTAVRESADPTGMIVGFADAVFAAAVKLGDWPATFVGDRRDGWHASREPMVLSPASSS